MRAKTRTRHSVKLISASDGRHAERGKMLLANRHSVKLISASDGIAYWQRSPAVFYRHSVKLISASDGDELEAMARLFFTPPFGEADFSE